MTGGGGLRRLGFLIRGEAGQYHLMARGEPQPGDSVLVVLNANHEPVSWILPSIPMGESWERLVDTDAYVRGEGGLADHQFYADGAEVEVGPRSLVVMMRSRR